MKKTPRHQQISSELLSEILAGKHDHSNRLPSEAQLVMRFKVSRPTVARALLDLKAKGVLERRAGSGTYLRKDRDAHPGLRHLGLLVPGLGKIEIMDVICGELANLARVNDLGMHWGGSTCPSADKSMSIDEAEGLCSRYIATGVSGVFFAPFEHTTDNEAANRRITERLSHAGIPVVLIDRDICAFPQRSPFDLVGIDNFAGGYVLADHLIKLGAKRLAVVTRPFSAATIEARKAGASAAMHAHGLTVPRDFLHAGDPGDVKFARKLIAGRQYDAVICTNDHTAAQLLQSLTRLNLKVPQNLRLVGFDDVRYATLLAVPLTTIQQPCRDIAITAFNAMRERIANPTLPARSLLLTPRLVVRESCGTYAAK
ncbi:MAG: GntR family transcriptional regulator [Verrucomicrobia bacterium]|nr:GntR family transcriptional regulator [Verrucomicrobiota bacterium]